MAVATTQFSGRKTDIEGLLIFDVTLVEDDRGYYQEKFQRAKLIESGLPSDFNIIQNNISYNKEAGVIRGFHAEPWNKYISVVSGEVFAAYVDLRDGPTFGKVVTVTINPNTTIYLPKGVGNSFQTTKDDTYYSYLQDAHWSADKYDEYLFVNLADNAIGVNWPISLENSVMSDRDKNHPLLKDIKPIKF